MPTPINIQKQVDWLEELAAFLVKANRRTFAADAESTLVETGILGKLRFVWEEGEWKIVDEFDGWFGAPGQTQVLYRGRVAWKNSYGGRSLSPYWYDLSDDVVDFIRQVLLATTVHHPVRGLLAYSSSEFEYHFSFLSGGLESGVWKENISAKSANNVQVFEQIGICDIVIHRDDAGQPLYPWDFPIAA